MASSAPCSVGEQAVKSKRQTGIVRMKYFIVFDIGRSDAEVYRFPCAQGNISILNQAQPLHLYMIYMQKKGLGAVSTKKGRPEATPF